MTFLFLESQTTNIEEVGQNKILHVTRTSQGVTLLYLSHFEPDTPFQCMYELSLLLVNPGLDHYFRDEESGKLKKNFIFIVDNGPQEKPSNSIVQMCMVRLLKFLKLHRIIQIAFAEYHSKKNFVERVHAEENRVLSKHGPFSSHMVNENVKTGSTEHRENMECMAEEVEKCIRTAQFGKKPLLCYRGVRSEDFLFNDEERLHSFLSLSEQRKEDSNGKYKVRDVELLHQLHFIWGVDVTFKGDYYEDYKLLNNYCSERTAWKDKYTTVLFSPSSEITCSRKEVQPIPDLFRWLDVHELHYMPCEEVLQLRHGPWDESYFCQQKYLPVF